MLSQKVYIQKRTVYDLAMMFGDVGGLHDFFTLGLFLLTDIYAQKFLFASIMSKIFW